MMLFLRALNDLAPRELIGKEKNKKKNNLLARNFWLDELFSNEMTTQAIEIIANRPLELRKPRIHGKQFLRESKTILLLLSFL